MAREGRALLRTLLALGLMSAVCVAMAEGVLRLVAPIPLESDVRLEFTQNLPGLARHLVYEQNRWGYRSLSMHSLEKPPGTLRVLALGGSTTKQDTQSTEDTWTGILEARLNAALDGEARVEVLALGGSGKTAATRVALLRESLERVDPDVLVTLEGVNDLAWNGLPDYHYAGPEVFAATGAPPPTALSRCRERFQLCRRLKILRDQAVLWWAKRRGVALEWHSEFLGERRAALRALPEVAEPRRDPDPFVEFRDAMAALLDQARESGLRVVVLGQPVLWHADMPPAQQAARWFWVGTPDGQVRAPAAWMQREMRRYNEAQREAARARGYRYVELDGRIPKDLEHFFDDCHLTDRGSRLQAELVLPAVLAEVRAALDAEPSGGGGQPPGAGETNSPRG